MIKINHSNRVLIFLMGTLFIIGIGVATLYFSHQNKYTDHRVIAARDMYSRYDKYAQTNDFVNVFLLLDSIENIYSTLPHYANSFEVGVLYNNRAAAYLTMALHFKDSSLSLDGVTLLSKDSLKNVAKVNAEISETIYSEWLSKYGNYTSADFERNVRAEFLNNLSVKNNSEANKYWKIRLKELELAQLETNRRLSVVYTNLGIIERHSENYEQAVGFYQKALDLWDRNLTAENNLNLLLDRPLKKQNFIHRILPPDKSN